MRQRETEERHGRSNRVPLGVPRRKLEVDPSMMDPDKVYRWINDKHDRLNAADRAGYEFVSTSAGAVGSAGSAEIAQGTSVDSRISRVVGSDESGRPIRAYLMAIDKVWYEEDQRAKAAQLDSIEASIKRVDEEAGNPGDTSNRYVPRHTPITIEHGKSK